MSTHVRVTQRSCSTGYLLLLAVVLAGCGRASERPVHIAADASTSAPSAPTSPLPPSLPTSSTSSEPAPAAPSTSSQEPDQLQLVCNGVALPADDPTLSGLELAGPDGDAAWDAAAATYGVDLRGDSEWRILRRTPDELQLIADALPGGQPSGIFTLATFARDRDAWVPGNLNGCAAQWGRDGWLNVDTIEMDMSRRTPADATSLELVVLDDTHPCGTGDPDSIVTVVDETPDTVSIVVLTEPAPTASSICPDGFQSVTVALQSPLGDREVLDGSTRPGRPLTVVGPDQQLNVIMLGPSFAGWWDGDDRTWVDADPVTPGIPLAQGTQLQVASLDGQQPSVVAGNPVRDCEPLGTWTASLEPVIDSAADTVAVEATWPLLPRPVTVLSPTIPEYERAVVDHLGRRGLSDVPVAVDQVIRADLDGDGLDEVVVAAHHPDAVNGVGAPAGSFSVVLLRRVVDGGVDTIALFKDLHPVADTDLPTMLFGTVSAIADLNGDDVMEIAIRWRSFEGSGIDVYETATDAPNRVLTTSCGS
jgi:hypothetical protein